MKCIAKLFAVILIMTVMFSLNDIVVSAASDLQDGLECIIAADKDNYKKNENICVSVSVKNTQNTAVENLTIESFIPDGYKLHEKSKNTLHIDSLSPDETAELKVSYVSEASGTFILYVMLSAGLLLIAAAVIFAVVFKKKRAAKLLVLMLLSSVTVFGFSIRSPAVRAEETKEKTVSLSQKITIDGKEQSIRAEVRYSVSDNIDADEYYSQNAEIISVTDAALSETVPTEQEAEALFSDRGFEGYSIQTEYDTDGTAYGEQMNIGSHPDRKHPLYELYYNSEKEMIWTVYLVNGAVYAYPVSYNLVSQRNAPLLVTESDTVMSYDSDSNQYYETIPNKESVITVKVERIDIETLNHLDMEGLANYEEE